MDIIFTFNVFSGVIQAHLFGSLRFLFRFFREKWDALSWIGTDVMQYRVSCYYQDLVGKMKDAAKSLEKATQMWGACTWWERPGLKLFCVSWTHWSGMVSILEMLVLLSFCIPASLKPTWIIIIPRGDVNKKKVFQSTLSFHLCETVIVVLKK